jgi:hypothetical protein
MRLAANRSLPTGFLCKAARSACRTCSVDTKVAGLSARRPGSLTSQASIIAPQSWEICQG